MIKVRHEITIDRPVEEVFAAYEDHESHYSWQPSLVHKEHHEKLQKGTKVTEVHNFMGRKVELTGEITEYELNRTLGFTGSGPHTRAIHYINHFSATATGTHLVGEVEVDVHEFLGLAEPLIEKVVKRDLVRSFEQLKDVHEMSEHHGPLKDHLPQHDHRK